MQLRALLTTLMLTLWLIGCASQPHSDEVAAEEGPTDLLPHIDPEVVYHVGAAEILAQREEYLRAADHYVKAARLSDDPSFAARALRMAATVNDVDLIQAAAERWLELDPAHPEPRSVAAALALREGDAERAWTQIRAMLDANPADVRWQEVAKVLGQSQQREAAQSLYLRLIETYEPPESAAVYRVLSDLAVRFGQFDRAAEYAGEAIRLDEHDAEAWAWRGRIHTTMGDREAAAHDFAAAIELEPEDETLRQSYAAILADLERFDEALETLAPLPDSLLTLYSRAAYAHAAEDHSLAEQAYAAMQALEVDDASEKAFFLGQLGESLEKPSAEILAHYAEVKAGERLDDARLRSAVVLAQDDQLAQARVILRKLQNANERTAVRAWLTEAGLVRDALGDAEAMAVYERALGYFPDNTDLLFARSLHAERMDDLVLAEADLRRILELQPEDANALNALGYTLADRTDRFEEAKELIERAYAQQPKEAAIVDSMGWVYFKLGDYETALSYLEEAARLDDDPEIAAHLGEVLWVMGREEEARQVWARALDDNPEAEVVLETQERLTQ